MHGGFIYFHPYVFSWIMVPRKPAKLIFDEYKWIHKIIL